LADSGYSVSFFKYCQHKFEFDFVYVRSRFLRSIGVEELEQAKLALLLQLKYGSTRDVVDILDRPDKNGKVVSGFQRYLYLPETRIHLRLKK
jgi:hypothetical protein